MGRMRRLGANHRAVRRGRRACDRRAAVASEEPPPPPQPAPAAEPVPARAGRAAPSRRPRRLPRPAPPAGPPRRRPSPPPPAPAAPAPEPQVLRDEAPVRGREEEDDRDRRRVHERHDQRLPVLARRRDRQRGRHGDLEQRRPHAALRHRDDGSFDTGIMDEGGSGSHTFTEAGTFGYICTPHPNMKGTVTVQPRPRAAGRQDTGRPAAAERHDGLPGRRRPGAAVDGHGRRRAHDARPGRSRWAPTCAGAPRPRRPAGRAHRLVAARANLRRVNSPQDPRGRGQAGPRRARPRRQDHRPRPARRRHGGDLHGPAPDARADRRDRAPGGRRRRRACRSCPART